MSVSRAPAWRAARPTRSCAALRAFRSASNSGARRSSLSTRSRRLALGHGGVENAAEDHGEEDARKEAGERGQGRAAEDPSHRANLYPTPTTVSMTSSPIFLRSERMWTSTVRVSMSAA